MLLIAIISSVDHTRMAAVTSMFSFSRSIGQILGVTLSNAVIQNRVSEELTRRITGPGSQAIIDEIRHDLSSLHKLPDDLRAVAIDSYAHALHTLLWCTLIVAALAYAFLFQCGPAMR